ncbi:MAG: cupin domain-containing protein [Clostridia bacterium]|nr:cupin domain-containing protein [Clostridia bacterium]
MSVMQYFYNPYTPYNFSGLYAPTWFNTPMFPPPNFPYQYINLRDYGPYPFVVNIEQAVKQNNNFRLALWTGRHLQITLMSIGVGEDIGLEMHPDVDQFIRIEQGEGLVLMGDTKNRLNFRRRVYADYAIVIPAGKWHNVINTGSIPLKLYSIYAPPEHPHGTVHVIKKDAEEHHD